MLLPKRTKKFNISRDMSKPVVLDDKVDDFIDWYKKNLVWGRYTDIGDYLEPINLRNFIEKMAIWFELRYPSYEINRMMPGSNQESTNVDEVMFNSNPYINEQLDEESDVRLLDWNRFYNFETFLKSLSINERYYLKKYNYPSIVYFDLKNRAGHLHLNNEGYVLLDELTSFIGNNGEGKHITEVVKDLKDKGVEIPKDSEFLSAIRDDELKEQQINGLLDSVMYRLIERGGNRIGPRRAYLFAKEFKRDLSIPLMYGIDTSDPGLRLFINQYLKDGGNPDLQCYIGYGFRSSKYEMLWTISIRELLKSQWHNAKDFYTPEEIELHERLVNVLSRKLEK